jgi:hypothetical protein
MFRHVNARPVPASLDTPVKSPTKYKQISVGVYSSAKEADDGMISTKMCFIK